MLGIGQAMGQRFVFAGSVQLLASHIKFGRSEWFQNGIINSSQYIVSTVHRSHLITLSTKAIDTTSISSINLHGYAAGVETSPVFRLQKTTPFQFVSVYKLG